MKKADPVSLFFSAIMLIGILIPDFMNYKASRILLGNSISASDCFGDMVWVLYVWVLSIFVLSVVKGKRPIPNLLTGLFAAGTLAFFLRAVSLSFESGVLYSGGNSRLSFGIGFFLVVLSLYSIMVKCAQYINYALLKGSIPVLALALVFFFLFKGELDNYSVMREYMTAQKQFVTRLWEHVNISLWVLVVSTIIGVPAGYMCYKHRIFDSVTLIGLSITEVLPQLALFALIRIPFAFLRNHVPFLKLMGIGGFGPAPAFTALLIYALYLVIHNARAAFSMADHQLIENAYAMGMTPRAVMFRVEIPVALPVLLAGLRITMVTTLVGATLASTIGAGGLGMYVVLGGASSAIDMQLLGIVPIFFLTVVTDAVLRLIVYLVLPAPGKGRNLRDLIKKRF